MERFLPIVYIVGWLTVVFAASYLINWLLIRSVIRKQYRYFVAPGVIVHELSHALGCMATGAQILEINFWKKTGGHVKHYQPKIPIIGEAVIALAPIWGTFLLLFILTSIMMPGVIQLFDETGFSATSLVRSIDWASWQVWLYFYLVTSLLATIAPSKTDLRYAVASLIAIAAVIVLLSFIPAVPALLLDWFALLKPFAIFTVVLLGLGTVAAFLLALPNRNKHFVAKEQIE